MNEPREPKAAPRIVQGRMLTGHDLNRLHFAEVKRARKAAKLHA